jgi:hypothetical protein
LFQVARKIQTVGWDKGHLFVAHLPRGRSPLVEKCFRQY